MNLSSMLRALAASAVLIALLSPARAADEDMNASVYLTFDPVTGEFIQQQDTSGNPSPGKHAQAPASQPSQQQNAAAPAADNGPVAGAGDSGRGIADLWLGGVIALGLLAGIGLWIRKGQQKAPT